MRRAPEIWPAQKDFNLKTKLFTRCLLGAAALAVPLGAVLAVPTVASRGSSRYDYEQQLCRHRLRI